MSARPRNAYAAPSWAAEQRVRDVGSKAVLLTLANYADEDFSCFPGQERLADETEQSVRQVRRQLAYLEALGLIVRSKRYGAGGHRTSNRYALMLDVTVAVDRDDPRRALLSTPPAKRLAEDEGAAHEAAPEADGSPTGQTVPKEDEPPRGQWDADLEDSGDDPYRTVVADELLENELPEDKLPDKNPPYPPQAGGGASDSDALFDDLPPDQPKPKATRRTQADSAEPEGFAEWYQTYPRHIAPRNAARAYINALKRGATVAGLLAGAARVRDDRSLENDWKPYPATWLNADGWLNEGPLGSRRRPHNVLVEPEDSVGSRERRAAF